MDCYLLDHGANMHAREDEAGETALVNACAKKGLSDIGLFLTP